MTALAPLILLLAARWLPPVPAVQNPYFAMGSDAGRLTFTPTAPADPEGAPAGNNGRYWRYAGDRAEYDDYQPRGIWDGRVSAFWTPATGEIELVAWRMTYSNWQVTCVGLAQDAEGVAYATYRIRTPAGMSDITVEISEPSLPLLLARHPEVVPLLCDLFAAMGARYEHDPAVAAQIDPAGWREPPGLAGAIAKLLPGLDAPDWRDRDRVENDLAAMGRDAAVYLMRVDRYALTPQQNAAADRVIRRWPVLTAEDRAACRREPGRLRALGYAKPWPPVAPGKRESTTRPIPG